MRGTEYAARPNDSAYPDIQHSWLQQQSLFFQQAPAKKVNISIFNHHMISKLFARELYSKHHFAHSVLNIYTQNKHFYSSKHKFPTEAVAHMYMHFTVCVTVPRGLAAKQPTWFLRLATMADTNSPNFHMLPPLVLWVNNDGRLCLFQCALLALTTCS